MKQICAPDDVRQLGTILSVGAHPDDETFTAGGILAAAVKNGQRVVCVTATKGEAGSQDPQRWPTDTLGETRSAELAAALEILGVSEHQWLGYQDGQCSEVDSEAAVGQLLEIMQEVQPDSILTFGPDGLTGHPDHQTVSAWVSAAISQLAHPPVVYHVAVDRQKYDKYLQQVDAKLNIFFNIQEPPLLDAEDCAISFNCTDELSQLKLDALAAMPSQMTALLSSFDPDFIRKTFEKEVFVKASPEAKE